MNSLFTPPSVAVIGCGHWGKNHVRNFYELGALTAISDTNAPYAQQIADQYSVKALSLEEICTSQDISGVVIASPAELHADIAKQCLRAHKHVLIEKPIALHLNDAVELIDLAKQQNCILMVGHLLQYHPAFLKLKNLVHSGELGSLQYIYSNRLSLGKVRSEEDVLWSFAPHDISMILSLTKELPQHVQSFGQKYLQPHIADTSMTHLTFPSGTQAHIFASWIHPYKEHKLIAIGEKAMAVFDDTLPWEQKLCLYPHHIDNNPGHTTIQKADAVPVHVEAGEPLKNECNHFLDCIAENRTPVTDGYEALNVLKVLTTASVS